MKRNPTRMKKVASVFFAGALALAMSPVYAFADEPADTGDAPAAGATAQQVGDKTIKVTNLDSNVTSVDYYKIVKFENNVFDINDKLGNLTINDIKDGITIEEAATIAANVGNAAGQMTISGTEATATVDYGTYMVIVNTSDAKTIYQPMFVSADFEQGGNELSASDKYKDKDGELTDVAKKSTVEIDKSVVDASQASVAYGDTVAFKIETNIPGYKAYAIDPTFEVSDTLSKGLQLLDSPAISVGVAGFTPEQLAGKYTVTKPGENGAAFKVSFDSAWLKTVVAPAKVTITYSAKVTADAAVNVNDETNTATLKFSNNPKDDSKFGTDEDKTKHYSFGIDANLKGGHGKEGIQEDKTQEIIKVHDQQTTTVTTTTTTTSSYETYALEGAEFTLYKNDEHKTEVAKASTKADGTLSFKGLDEGSYILKETKAPAGYLLDQSEHSVVISATYTEDSTHDKVLESYTITIDGEATSTYTMNYAESDPYTITSQTVSTSSETRVINNTPQPALPVTGGMGTMAITGIGVLLAAACVFMALRYRRSRQS